MSDDPLKKYRPMLDALEQSSRSCGVVGFIDQLSTLIHPGSDIDDVLRILEEARSDHCHKMETLGAAYVREANKFG